MHIPVLLEKVVEYLNPQSNQNFIDCTTGAGGHTMAILERTAPRGKVLALDQDPESIAAVQQHFRQQKVSDRVTLVQANFADLTEVARKEKFRPVHGILFDLGYSSDHLEARNRGFSFQRTEPLDMRYNPENPVSAEKLVNFSSKLELQRILTEYGQEQFAREIAQAIVQARVKKHITKTTQLVDIIFQATPKWYQRKRLHAATKTFQALRIATNRELENLEEALPKAVETLQEGGRIVVISFHSLEDRLVKTFFKNNPQLTPLAKKPIMAQQAEIRENPRARSAKLRAVLKTSS